MLTLSLPQDLSHGDYFTFDCRVGAGAVFPLLKYDVRRGRFVEQQRGGPVATATAAACLVAGWAIITAALTAQAPPSSLLRPLEHLQNGLLCQHLTLPVRKTYFYISSAFMCTSFEGGKTLFTV